MTSADPTGPARRPNDAPRMPSPPPPLYQPSDEISLDDPIVEAPPTAEVADAPRQPSSFAGPEPLSTPTGEHQRPGRPFRMFWLGFAANSTGLSLLVGAFLFSAGLSLRQTVLAGVVGVLLAGVVLVGLSRLGRRTGVPPLVASAEVFGSRGNLLPVAIVLISRTVIAGVLLWTFAASVLRVAELAGLPPAGVAPTIAVAAIGAIASGALAATGYRGIVIAQRVLTPVAVVALVWFVVAAAPSVDVRVAATIADGPPFVVVSGAVVVFVLAGLLLAPGSGDLARFQSARRPGFTTGMWTVLSAAIPALLLVSFGTILAASDPATASGLTTASVDAIAVLLPGWYPVPLVVAIAAATLSAAAVSLYSGTLAVAATGNRIAPLTAAVLLTLLAVGTAGALIVSGDGALAVDLVTSAAVPLSAWVGVLLGRRRSRPRTPRPGPVWWQPTIAVLVATAVGFGLTSATTGWLSWQGYFFDMAMVSPDAALATSDLGIVVALVVGVLLSVTLRPVTPLPRPRGTHRRP